jgi:hypothetical protein
MFDSKKMFNSKNCSNFIMFISKLYRIKKMFVFKYVHILNTLKLKMSYCYFGTLQMRPMKRTLWVGRYHSYARALNRGSRYYNFSHEWNVLTHTYLPMFQPA